MFHSLTTKKTLSTAPASSEAVGSANMHFLNFNCSQVYQNGLIPVRGVLRQHDWDLRQRGPLNDLTNIT
jgi:hypothetical protein